MQSLVWPFQPVMLSLGLGAKIFGPVIGLGLEGQRFALVFNQSINQSINLYLNQARAHKKTEKNNKTHTKTHKNILKENKRKYGHVGYLQLKVFKAIDLLISLQLSSSLANTLTDRPGSTAVVACSRSRIASRQFRYSRTRRQCRPAGRPDVSFASPRHCTRRSAVVRPCGQRSVVGVLRRTSDAA